MARRAGAGMLLRFCPPPRDFRCAPAALRSTARGATPTPREKEIGRGMIHLGDVFGVSCRATLLARGAPGRGSCGGGPRRHAPAARLAARCERRAPPSLIVRCGPCAPRSDEHLCGKSRDATAPLRRGSASRIAWRTARSGQSAEAAFLAAGALPPLSRPPRDPRHGAARARARPSHDTRSRHRGRSIPRPIFLFCGATSTTRPVERRAAGAQRKSSGGRPQPARTCPAPVAASHGAARPPPSATLRRPRAAPRAAPRTRRCACRRGSSRLPG